MAVNSMPESAYLKGLCLCTDSRDCWHGSCLVRRHLRFGRVLLENGAGNVLLAGRGQVTVKGADGQQGAGLTASVPKGLQRFQKRAKRRRKDDSSSGISDAGKS